MCRLLESFYWIFEWDVIVTPLLQIPQNEVEKRVDSTVIFIWYFLRGWLGIKVGGSCTHCTKWYLAYVGSLYILEISISIST